MIDLCDSPSLQDLTGLKLALIRLIETEADPRIETAALTGASPALVQLLFAAQRMAQARGKRLEISCPAKGGLATALTALGVEDALDTGAQIDAGRWTGLTTP
ncbi:hypothetical protein C8J30_109144 [Rhodobacter viridis]|uniref:STAS domain-containing protein n=1 Tax=Rhodobacter viridis TaxID=1054202 RepID=A0A318U2A4_9RHOB|nr:hypothetical protein [Rhodobacter viridis]PYF09398.1 hypothetical protein C8J30_109144 [Rhodobacter viridis]